VRVPGRMQVNIILTRPYVPSKSRRSAGTRLIFELVGEVFQRIVACVIVYLNRSAPSVVDDFDVNVVDVDQELGDHVLVLDTLPPQLAHL
jgi:hypothetical protein